MSEYFAAADLSGLPPEGLAVVGFSGGADSMALAHWLSGKLPRERLDQLKDAVSGRSPEEALLHLFEFWEIDNRRFQKEQNLASEAVQLIWSNRGALRIKDLEQETLYSARRLQEVVTRQVGIGPKQLCRQTRFQNALKLLTSPRAGVYTQAEAAQILGYSDQSHYTREFKKFSGVCPCQFQKQI